ncbi:SusC/RagA family TonB-linked outer membrane protein [Chitinophaga sancti]|uniref:SusC/RagA family TonB-linked outer membrane protein n=2 Tax=Chitinophaga sancti TaxID=1004 RepID=A0ABZ0XGY1_9BACT|nr:SusC/RagA family TonB-linked outer membrane protein [Chitinophaga sancti]WQD64653.1 SusC/RagA family TonB-linked outer membrane protein [Chitinophaga sancti]WQG89725.1 SusC/RagA family TonB-linked outer membrane protein [Chitinophaga sancti]
MKTKAICCLLTLSLLMCLCVKAQEKLSIHVVNEPIFSVLRLVEKQAGVLFAYRNDIVDVNERITIHWDNVSLPTILDVIFPSSLYELRTIGKQIIILKKGTPMPVMPPRVIDINPVVITALGISRQQQSLGYAYTDLGPQTFTTNPVNSLAGRVSGLNISPVNSGVGGATKVTLRGLKIIGGDNTPLFVIDGIPVNNSSPGQADKYGGYDLGDGTSIINPDEIASISILKGGAASALYGSRAANGVMLITTKKGAKGFSVAYTSNTLVEILNDNYDFQHTYGSGQDGMLPKDISTARVDAQTSWGPEMNKDSTVVIWDGSKVPYVNASNAISKFFRKGLTLANTVSLSTGSDKVQVRAAYSNVRENDIIPLSKLNRHYISLRCSAKLSAGLTVDAKGTYLSEDVYNRPALSDNPNNIGYVLSGIAPNIDIRWLKTYKDPVSGNYINWNNNAYQVNPYWAINEQPNNSTQRRFNGFVLIKYQLWPGLYIQGRTGTDYSRFNFTEFMEYSTPYYTTGGIAMLHRNLQETNSDLLVNYHKQWGKLSLEVNVGTNRMDYKEDLRNETGRGMKIRGAKDLSNFNTQLGNHQLYRKRINSVYGAVTLGYNDFLYLDLTGRNDWSSTLSAGHNAYFYPSASASFVFSSLLPSISILSFGKLRASIAQTGTDAVAPYQTALTYATNPNIPSVGGYLIGGVATDKVPYENLKPSLTRSYETGLNMVFYNNRIQVDLTWYHSNTRNQILNAPISPTSGYTSAVINSGNVSNEGLEIALGGRPVCHKDFTWQVNVNFARNKNKIISLSSLVSDYYTLATARWGNASIIAKAGAAYGMITGRKFLRDDKGRLILDANNLPQYTAADYNLGSTQYNWIGGITNTFNYRRWSFAVLLDIRQGGKIFSMTNLLAYQKGQQKGSLEGREGWARSERERVAAGVAGVNWTPTGGLHMKGVKVIAPNRPQYQEVEGYVNPETYWTRVSENIPEPFIYDASMVKIRELTLGYKVLENVAVAVTARNVLTLSKHIPNIDPESSYNNGDGQGFEYGSLPTRSAYGITLHAKF